LLEREVGDLWREVEGSDVVRLANAKGNGVVSSWEVMER
jgi:hypothetical protein